MAINIIPEWMNGLEDEDLVFIKKFLLSSGSLKEIAEQYGVTYPTVRLKLDKVIQKVKFIGQTYTTTITEIVNGISTIVKTTNFSEVGNLILTILIVNIPTYVYITVYIVIRKNIKKIKDVEKINIQSL